jgi:hypothetical protein
MKSGENHMTFQRNILLLSSGVKSKPSKKPRRNRYIVVAESGGDIFL